MWLNVDKTVINPDRKCGQVWVKTTINVYKNVVICGHKRD